MEILLSINKWSSEATWVNNRWGMKSEFFEANVYAPPVGNSEKLIKNFRLDSWSRL